MSVLFNLWLRTGVRSFLVWASVSVVVSAETVGGAGLEGSFRPPTAYAEDTAGYDSLLQFEDGGVVRNRDDWAKRREEIRRTWLEIVGEPPALIAHPKVETVSRSKRENFVQKKVRVEIAPGQMADGYILIPEGEGPFPAVVVPYYEPESSIGMGKVKLRDFAYQLTKRGFVSLAIGSPGGDARKPKTGEVRTQPLMFLGYVAANCAQALGEMEEVDRKRIGIVGHSYGGKWAMFAAAFYENFACGVWSDPGIVFDETRSNVNYWEPWYLGLDEKVTRKPGIPTEQNPRTGAYQQLMAEGRDLHEVMALMAPRPFLVSGGAEDGPERWRALNRVREVYALFGISEGVGMTNRPKHDPTKESNEQIYQFFESQLKPRINHH